VNKDRLIFVTLRFIAFDIVLEKSVPEFNASATSAPRQNKCRCADNYGKYYVGASAVHNCVSGSCIVCCKARPSYYYFII